MLMRLDAEMIEKPIPVMEYPRSRIPTQPLLSLSSFFRGKCRSDLPSVLDAGNALFVTSGRVAIALALQQMKIAKGDKVLVPAYHCASMVEPVIWLGATPVFYKINADTTVDLDDLKAKLGGSTKVLMATNYFGFPQNLADIRRFCDDNSLLFLEDCAHSFMGEYQGKPLGSFGDYSIASAMKFFPIYEGGCLVSSRHEIGNVRLESAGLGFELKSALNAMEKGFAYGRMSFLKTVLSIPMWLKRAVWAGVKSGGTAKQTSLGPGASDGGFSFEPAWMNKRSSLFSRGLIGTVSKSRIAARRRDNYLTLHRSLAGLPGCRPLFATLPDGVSPYVYPLVCDNLKIVFPILKNAGVPVIRFAEFLWDGVDASVCPVSIELSEQCMQFPCHQDLRAEELNWMIEKIRSLILGQGSDKK
jgi:perosamine synthetase